MTNSTSMAHASAAQYDPAQLLADELAGKYPDARGRFGPFGGRYIPETLTAAFEKLEAGIRQHLHAPDFQAELAGELKSWVGRPTALTYAPKLSRAWGAEVWLKREDLAHTGAHKINNALGQALLAKRLGVTRIVAETGAGQHGVASAAACARVGLPCTVYMGAVDMERQAPNVGSHEVAGDDRGAGDQWRPDIARRDRRGVSRLGQQSERHVLHHRLGRGPASVSLTWCASCRP